MARVIAGQLRQGGWGYSSDVLDRLHLEDKGAFVLWAQLHSLDGRIDRLELYAQRRWTAVWKLIGRVAVIAAPNTEIAATFEEAWCLHEEAASLQRRLLRRPSIAAPFG